MNEYHKTQEVRQVDPLLNAEVPIPKELYNKIIQYDSKGVAHVKVEKLDNGNLIIRANNRDNNGSVKTADVVALISIEGIFEDNKKMKYRTFNVITNDDSIELHFYSDKCVFCGKEATIGRYGVAYYDRCVCPDCYNLVAKSDILKMNVKQECVFCGKEDNKCSTFAGTHICEQCMTEIKRTPLE